jgi:transposase
MIRAGFLEVESRQDLVNLVRDGSVAHRLVRRANALLLLDGGMSCAAVGKVLFIDDDTVRTLHQQYQEDGIEGLANFGHKGGSCRLTSEQQDKLKAWISETLPRTTREVGAWIELEFDIEYESRSGLIALLHRLGMARRRRRSPLHRRKDGSSEPHKTRWMAVEAMYPGMRVIHIFLDNARYHHAKLVQAWLAEPGRRIKLHFIPTYCPRLNPIERLWRLMHKHISHNRYYASFRDFSTATLTFLRDQVPANWTTWCDDVTDNFRVIDPKDFRVLA